MVLEEEIAPDTVGGYYLDTKDGCLYMSDGTHWHKIEGSPNELNDLDERVKLPWE